MTREERGPIGEEKRIDRGERIDREERISGYLDGELSPEERAAFDRELARSPELQGELADVRAMKEVTDSMKLTEFPDRVWEQYWRGTYNRIERGIGWILVSIGGMILLARGLYEMAADLLHGPEPWWLRAAIGLLSLGFAVLFVSVVRERIMRRRHDRYREVKW